MTYRRAFKSNFLQTMCIRTNISKITPHQTSGRVPFSSQQAVRATPDEASNRSSTSSTGQHLSKNRRGQIKRSTRVFPVRKRFIYESYVDLFTSNQVCLLFRHHSLNSRQWNSIRGQVKNVSSPLAPSLSFGEFKFTEEHEEARLKQQVPKVQVMRTKMILPVLKKLLKESKIDKGTYNSLVYSSTTRIGKDKKITCQLGPSHLTGSLFSITQKQFEPDQIKKIIKILDDYSKPEGKIQGKEEKKPKVQFLIGLIDQSIICKDQQELKKLSNTNSLETSRSQIISLLNLPVQNLLSNLNFARASNLIFTLKSHIKTQQLDNPVPSSNQPSDVQLPA